MAFGRFQEGKGSSKIFPTKGSETLNCPHPPTLSPSVGGLLFGSRKVRGQGVWGLLKNNQKYNAGQELCKIVDSIGVRMILRSNLPKKIIRPSKGWVRRPPLAPLLVMF